MNNYGGPDEAAALLSGALSGVGARQKVGLDNGSEHALSFNTTMPTASQDLGYGRS